MGFEFDRCDPDNNPVPDGYHSQYSDDAGKQKDEAWEPVQAVLIDLCESRDVRQASKLQSQLQESEGGA